MRIAYLDCFSGISGDMFLGALVDAGVSPDLLRDTVRALNVGAELEITRVLRNGISATKVDVIVNGEKDLPREEFWEKQHTHTHNHEHHHHDDRAPFLPAVGRSGHHEHSRSEGEGSAVSQGHDDRAPFLPAVGRSGHHEHSHSHEHRSLKDIRAIINNSSISARAKQTALAIFQALGEAEARIHNKDLDSIHFHEVGSADAIVDIVCAAVGSEALAVDAWHCSPLNVGGGVVHCAHGTLPVPAPATVELLRGAPVYSSGIQKELVTPTGAAIVRTLISNFGELPSMSVNASGYGAGSRDLPGNANVLRITLGESVTKSREVPQDTPDVVTVLEATIDDMTPQVFGFVIERLLQEGALDAFGLPVQMKKSRPGMLLTVLSRNEDAQRIADLIFAETTTIGLRTRQEQRMTLQREWVPVETQWGTVRIKLARLHGEETNAMPEFEDCRKIAIEHRVALKRVMTEAMRAYMDQKDKTGA
ncbi:MAG TPA: nickel pincer cofactor biosynthesis protein LarC [Terriglobales bacterium]